MRDLSHVEGIFVTLYGSGHFLMEEEQFSILKASLFKGITEIMRNQPKKNNNFLYKLL